MIKVILLMCITKKYHNATSTRLGVIDVAGLDFNAQALIFSGRNGTLCGKTSLVLLTFAP